MTRLDELVEIEIPDLEFKLNGEPLNEDERNFLGMAWDEIRNTENTMQLYYKLVCFLIQFAKLNPTSPLLQNGNLMGLLTVPEYDDGKRPNKQFPAKITFKLEPEYEERVLQEKFSSVWQYMIESEEVIGASSEELKNMMTLEVTERLAAHQNRSGSFSEFPKSKKNVMSANKWFADYIVNGTNLVDVNEDFDPVIQAHYRRILLSSWRRASSGSDWSKSKSNPSRILKLNGALTAIHDELTEDEIFQNTSYQVIKDYINTMTRIESAYPILFFYIRRFHNLIADPEEINNVHRKILYKVLTDNAIGYVRQKYSKDYILNDVVDKYIRYTRFDLRVMGYFALEEQGFKFNENKRINIVENALSEINHFLYSTTFINNIPTDHDKSRGLKKIKIQALKTDSTGSEFYATKPPYFIWDPKKLTLSNNRNNPNNGFLFSETGFDQYVYSPDMRYKYDFGTRVVYEWKKKLNAYDLIYDYYNPKYKGKRLNGFIFYLQEGFENTERINDVFNFRRNWQGVYHCIINKGTPKLSHDIASFKSVGTGFGIARADNVDPGLYVWFIQHDANSERIEKLGVRLGLDLDRNINFKAFIHDDLLHLNGFMHEFIQFEDEQYVRVNLPYIKLENVKNPIESEASKAILNSIEIVYYRKVDSNKRIIKSDAKNRPFSEPNLPISFNLTNNYLFLHRNRYVENVTKIKWLDKVQRKRKTLESAKTERKNLKTIMKKSATAFTREAFSGSDTRRQIWEVIKTNFTTLPTDQEWCHMQGHGDGGPDRTENIVSGSNHCNTEQLAIELGQRRSTHTSPGEFSLNSTVYIFNTSNENRIKSLKRKRSDSADRQVIKKRKLGDGSAESTTKGDSDIMEVDEDNLIEMDQNDAVRIGAFFRYKIYRRGEKIFDYTFEGQNEFFDRNMYNIINRLVEFTLKGEQEFNQWLGLTL